MTELLNRGHRVTIHAKPHPTFVADVTLPDLDDTITRLSIEPGPAAGVAETLNDGPVGRDTGHHDAHASGSPHSPSGNAHPT